MLKAFLYEIWGYAPNDELKEILIIAKNEADAEKKLIQEEIGESSGFELIKEFNYDRVLVS